MSSLARINLTPVKGLALAHPPSLELGPAGAATNRRFYLTSAGRLFNGKDHGPLVRIASSFEQGWLSLSFPGGLVVEGEVVLGAPVETDFWGRPVAGFAVEGPWAEALSEYAGAAVQLVQTAQAGTGTDVAVGTMLSRASCRRLAEELGSAVDPRRFRMLFEFEGAAAHEEDGWEGRRVRIGDAVLLVGGPVPRCAVTTQDPDSGAVSLDTLRGIKNYRGLRDGKWIDFGVYFDVSESGHVSVGDELELL